MNVVLFGAGGHGKVVLDCCRSCVPTAEVVFGDDGAGRREGSYCGCAVVGGRAVICMFKEGWYYHVAIGDNRLRGEAFLFFLQAGLSPLTLVHPSSVVSDSAVVGAGTLVMPRVVVNAGARIGVNCILNTGAIIEHDCVIGDHTHVSPGAVLGGGVQIGAYTHVGLGAVILPGAEIGCEAVIGAGAVVLRRVDAGVTVIGVPARRIR
jgi:acetyltransferase EpsM